MRDDHEERYPSSSCYTTPKTVTPMGSRHSFPPVRPSCGRREWVVRAEVSLRARGQAKPVGSGYLALADVSGVTGAYSQSIMPTPCAASASNVSSPHWKWSMVFRYCGLPLVRM